MFRACERQRSGGLPYYTMQEVTVATVNGAILASSNAVQAPGIL